MQANNGNGSRQEVTVDNRLEQHIASPLENEGEANAGVLNIGEDENAMEDDVEEDKSNGPIKTATKNKIYHNLSALGSNVEHRSFNQVTAIKNMTEGEGKAYLEMLNAMRTVNFSKYLCRTYLKSLTEHFCARGDLYTPDLISHDENLVGELAASIGGVTSMLGEFKSYLMVGIYLISSWSKNWHDPANHVEAQKEVEDAYAKHGKEKAWDKGTPFIDARFVRRDAANTATATDQAEHHARATIQGNGGVEKPDG